MNNIPLVIENYIGKRMPDSNKMFLLHQVYGEKRINRYYIHYDGKTWTTAFTNKNGNEQSYSKRSLGEIAYFIWQDISSEYKKVWWCKESYRMVGNKRFPQRKFEFQTFIVKTCIRTLNLD